MKEKSTKMIRFSRNMLLGMFVLRTVVFVTSLKALNKELRERASAK